MNPEAKAHVKSTTSRTPSTSTSTLTPVPSKARPTSREKRKAPERIVVAPRQESKETWKTRTEAKRERERKGTTGGVMRSKAGGARGGISGPASAKTIRTARAKGKLTMIAVGRRDGKGSTRNDGRSQKIGMSSSRCGASARDRRTEAANQARPGDKGKKRSIVDVARLNSEDLPSKKKARVSGSSHPRGFSTQSWKAFMMVLHKGPNRKQKKAFKLSKSLLPLGIWLANRREDFDIASEWKASTLKRMENPAPYRRLKANLYSDPSQRGLDRVDEVPLCHCKEDTGCDDDCINRQLLMECAPGRCPTLRPGSRHCLNSAIQTKSFPATEANLPGKWSQELLDSLSKFPIFRTFDGRGWGLRLSEKRGAKSGALLHEYLGEVIDMDECRERLGSAGTHHFYFASLDGNLVLDAGPMGSEARFANHSCAPNCVLQKWSVLGETRVVLRAARDISLGEELTYNYNADTLGGYVERQKCLCGEPQCARFIGGEPVKIKAKLWQERTSKVMSQAKPQLEMVQKLFREGRELGLEEKDEADGVVRYRGREMECLSVMVREGEDWLARLAHVMEEQTTVEKSKESEAEAEAEAGEEESRKVDMVALERVLEDAPSGLCITEAVKAKKLATRGRQAARAVWSLLHAAAMHGLDVKIPEYHEPETSVARSVGRWDRIPKRNPPGGEPHAGPGEVFAAQPNGHVPGGAEARVDNREHEDVHEDSGQGQGTDEREKRMEALSSGENDDASQGVATAVPDGGPGIESRGRDAVCPPIPAPFEGTSCAGNPPGQAPPQAPEEVPPQNPPQDRAQESTGAGLSPAVALVPPLAPTPACVHFTRHRAMLNAGGGDSARNPGKAQGRNGTSSAASTAGPDCAFAWSPAAVPVEGVELPPKPRISQVCQAIRNCRGAAPVFVPGASELPKLVQPAELWALQACKILKIKLPTADKDDAEGQADTRVTRIAKDRDKEKEMDEEAEEAAGPGQETAPAAGAPGAPGPCEAKESKENKENKENEPSVLNKWEKLGLNCVGLTTLEEKLQEVAEFSLTREQREEELEKERAQKERVEESRARERDRQARRMERRGKHLSGHDGEGQDVEARRSLRFRSAGGSHDVAVADTAGDRGQKQCRGGDGAADNGDMADEGEGADEDEDELHCLCRLPAATARFRTLMTCDACHNWFHPACVRIKELRDSQRTSEPLAFVCPMCEHARGGISSFACPPSAGFYINRRMHRPGVEELEPLMAHAERLPVEGFDGEAYLSYMLEQVLGWRDRCQAAVRDVRRYIEEGPSALLGSNSSSSSIGHLSDKPQSQVAYPHPDASGRETTRPSSSPIVPEATPSSGLSFGVQKDAGGSKQAAGGAHSDQSGVGMASVGNRRDSGEGAGVSGDGPTGVGADAVPARLGLELPSVRRDLGVEAGLMERLGRLICEGALIEVVDIHKQDVLIRRALWSLAASISAPSLMGSLRGGMLHQGSEMRLSPADEESLEAGSRSLGKRCPAADAGGPTMRLRPTLATLEAVLTEGRTLGLSRQKRGKRPISSGGNQGGNVSATVTSGSGGSGGSIPPTEEADRRSSDLLTVGTRIYARLAELVTETIQAVVAAEASPFREARTAFPALRAACRWAELDGTWGYARARASELRWQRENASLSPAVNANVGLPGGNVHGTSASSATRATAAGGNNADDNGSGEAGVTAESAISGVGETPGKQSHVPAVEKSGLLASPPTSGITWIPDPGLYCLCRQGDDGGVMVSCDECSEWFHARCVGLSLKAAKRLKEYRCPACSEISEGPDKPSEYAYRWVTNAQVEAAVRRLVPRNPKAVKKRSVSAGSGEARDVEDSTGGDQPSNDADASDQSPESADEGSSPPKSNICLGKRQRTASARLAEANAVAAELSSSRCLASKRAAAAAAKVSHACEAPGAKRARAELFVKAYVKKHYGKLGVPWPPETPEREAAAENEPRSRVDQGTNTGNTSADTSGADAASARVGMGSFDDNRRVTERRVNSDDAPAIPGGDDAAAGRDDRVDLCFAANAPHAVLHGNPVSQERYGAGDVEGRDRGEAPLPVVSAPSVAEMVSHRSLPEPEGGPRGPCLNPQGGVGVAGGAGDGRSEGIAPHAIQNLAPVQSSVACTHMVQNAAAQPALQHGVKNVSHVSGMSGISGFPIIPGVSGVSAPGSAAHGGFPGDKRDDGLIGAVHPPFVPSASLVVPLCAPTPLPTLIGHRVPRTPDGAPGLHSMEALACADHHQQQQAANSSDDCQDDVEVGDDTVVQECSKLVSTESDAEDDVLVTVDLDPSPAGIGT